MPKISLAIEPTFQAKVFIPVPGSKPEALQFTFKYRTKDELETHRKELAERQGDISDVDVVMSVAEGWELDDSFSAENVGRLLQKYHAAANAIGETYIKELMQAKLGN